MVDGRFAIRPTRYALLDTRGSTDWVLAHTLCICCVYAVYMLCICYVYAVYMLCICCVYAVYMLRMCCVYATRMVRKRGVHCMLCMSHACDAAGVC
jgi:hypothetical protein